MSNEDLLYFEELEDSHPAPKRASPPSSAFSLSLLDGPLDFSVSADSRPATGGHLLWLDPIPNLNAPILQPTPAPAPAPVMTPMTPMGSPMIPGLPIVPRKDESWKTSPFDLDPVHSPIPGKLSSIFIRPVNLEPISPASAGPMPPPPSKAENTTLPTTTLPTPTLPTPEASPPAYEQIAVSVLSPVSAILDLPSTTSSRLDTPEIHEEPELIPRSYQIQMYEKALNENTIAVMDTGSGKTLVAAMLIKEMIRREIMANRDPTQRKLCIFVVNNVPLVKQQASVIRTQSRAEVVELCGSSKTKKLVETLWAQISANTYVVVLTAQILLDVLRHGYLHMRKISLLVFDECHHARKDHPFCFIMNEFYHNKLTQDFAQNPRIFGMTASPTSDIGSKMNQSTSNDENLTPKVQKLIQILRVTSKALKDEFCGIIFVQRRDTAAALTILLQELEEFHDLLRVEVLAGHSEGNHALLNMTLKEQDAIITRFRNKEYNLLVSTSVAEEGLDIQPCNIVIRFDPVTTTTSYMQSRGRARKKNSRYIMMQESNNHKEEATLEKIQYGEQSMREWYSDRPNQVSGEEDDQVQDKSTPEQQYLVPSTRALLTLSSAVPLLHRYCASLSTDEYCDWKPEFDVSASGASGFLCDLNLPPAAPIRYFQSDRTSTMDMARKSAAFKACEALHKLGAIDDHLDPVVKSAGSDGEGEPTNQPKASQNRSYPRNTPLFWNHGAMQEPKRLFVCTVSFAKDAHHHRHSYRTMCILTHKPLPFSDHRLNVFVKGKAREVIMRTSSAHLKFNHDQIALLRKFTIVLFQRMCRKDFDCEPDRMPYYVAPLGNDDDVSWDDVQMGQSTAVTPLDERPSEEEAILDLVVMLKNDRSSEHFVHGIVRGFKMTDVMPSDRFRAEIESYGDSQGNTLLEPTFGDYFKWKFKQDCAEEETILLVQRVKRMRNHLQPAPIDEKEQDDGALALVPLSACWKCSVCAGVLRVSQVIPSALFDLDSFLLVQEAQERVGLQDVRIDLLHVALTTSSANREYHYERLELLGDSFLKFSSTLRLFIVNPAKDEGQLHLSRTRIISNTTLLKHAEQLELYRYISSTPFHRKHWRPVHFIVDGKPWDNQQQHMLSNKTMADVIEAALGAAFLGGGSIVAFHAAKLLRVPFDEFNTWEDFARVYQESLTHHGSTDPASTPILPLYGEHQRHIDKVQKILGYTFKSPHLFMEAMTHASSARKDSGCYQRLEFLGDAVLDFQVIKYYYHKYYDAPPGAITLIKDASVNNQVLGALAIQWGLGEFLIHNSEGLASEIQRAIATLEMQKESSPTNTLEGEYWVNVKMPKVLGDLVESTLGAVFVDCRFDYTVICDVFDRLIRPFLDDHINLEQIVIHPTKALMEFVQSKSCNEARFKREEHEAANRSKNTMRRLGLGGRRGGRDANPTQVCKFMIHGEVIATSTGLDIEELRKQVAEEAMRKLQADPSLMDAKCNCPRKRRAGYRTMLDKYHEGRFANGLPVSLLD
ncbi:Dicer-like protein 1 [Mortierella antarctica]|nr:Dicer-like protein 1 [Mortierella antarctica]